MEPFVIIALQLSFVAGVIGIAVFAHKHARKKWLAALDNDPDVAPGTASWPAGLSLHTRRAPRIQCTARGGGKNNPPVWSLEGKARRIGVRTTLDISEEGFLGGLREKLGWQDVHTGDAGFDARYTIRGSNPDAIRGVLAVPAVHAALHATFGAGMRIVRISQDGSVVASAPRSGRESHEARGLTLALQALTAALDEHADAPAVAEPVPVPSEGAKLAASSASATGAPVPIPLKVK